MEKTKIENVTLKIPTNLLRLLKDKNYFGHDKDEFWLISLKRSIDAELNELPHDEMRRIEHKYGVEV